VNWKHGEDVIIAGSSLDDDAPRTTGNIALAAGKEPKPYIQPSCAARIV